MRLRATLITLTMVFGAALGVADGASAATLYTSGAHTTQVVVGSTASATNTSPVVFTSATSTINTCNNATLSFTIDQNSGGVVIGTVTAGTMTACGLFGWVGTYSTPWKLTVSGAPTTVGGVTRWAASITNVAFDWWGFTSGNLETGVTARQTGAGGQMCLDLIDAGQLTAPPSANFRIDTSFCFEGAAATYSLT